MPQGFNPGRFQPDISRRRRLKELYDQLVKKDRNPNAVRMIADDMEISTQAVYRMMRDMRLQSPRKYISQSSTHSSTQSNTQS